jgi:hypothetical protein
MNGIQSAPSRYCVHGNRRALCQPCRPQSEQKPSACRCGHVDGAHFDEVGVCSLCWCECFVPPGARLRDVLIPAMAEGERR